MSDSNEDIIITPITQVNIMNKFIIRKIEIIVKERAEISIVLYNETKSYNEPKYLVMSGDDYANWGTDDDYLINWIKSHLSI